jgi:DNA-binding NarL/FixJ family response regulator
MNPHTSPLSLVIADDHALLRFCARSVAEEDDLCIVIGEASNGEEAVEIGTRLAPRVVLMDMSMPGRVTGTEAAAALAALPGVAVVALTMHNDPRSIAAMLEAGVRSFVPKSEPPEELRRAIAAAAAGRTYFPPSIAETVAHQLLHPRNFGGLDFAPRELDVLRLTAAGKSVKETATRMGIEETTVRGYRKTLGRKIGATGAVALSNFYAGASLPSQLAVGRQARI